MSKIILGVQLKDRMGDAAKFQSILSKYGCSIQTRVGLHEATADSCSPSGIIVLDFLGGAEDEAKKFEAEVRALGEVNIQKMVF
jgi:hypothetical protein